MEPLSIVDAVAVPMAVKNVDTDQLIPSRFLWRPRQDGYAGLLFHDLRFATDGSSTAGFVLNQPAYRGAQILVADRNFGCGSSRENAVWALYDYGFRVIIAPSFGDIFFNSSFKNGLLPVVLPDDAVSNLRASLECAHGARIMVDLAAQVVTGPDQSRYEFSVDPFRKQLLLAGMDEIAFTQSYADRIADFETQFDQDLSWL
jgi:3-isopropylmalate/(R)-2-methylmalate dehydratase small subunit